MILAALVFAYNYFTMPQNSELVSDLDFYEASNASLQKAGEFGSYALGKFFEIIITALFVLVLLFVLVFFVFRKDVKNAANSGVSSGFGSINEFESEFKKESKNKNKFSNFNSSQKPHTQGARAIAQDAFELSLIRPIKSELNFSDVAGISEAKMELEEIVDYLKNPQKYRDFGISLPKGVLLIGPPGVGKTLIAKALAGEAGVPFFYQSGASFVQIYVGMGAKRVHDLFTKAKLSAPSIVFIDEIDAVGKARGAQRNDEREATLNQLLTEMDGFLDSRGVIVIGATNNVENLDEALLRAGRFDRRVYVELPNLPERAKILAVHCRGKACEFDYEEVARLSVGFSGAALSALVNEAALNAIKRGSKCIEMSDILAVREKVMIGVKKKLSFEDREKEILAYYQAAKAFSAYHLDVPFEKITLLNPELKGIEKEISSASELKNRLKVQLSGIAALELVFSERYSNAKSDLQEAKALAHKMVESYGMGEHLLGSQEDVAKILDECKDEMVAFFGNYTAHLNALKAHLLEHEKIEYSEIDEIISSAWQSAQSVE